MKLTEQQCAEAIELRRSGKTVRWIADKMGVSRTTVWKATGGKEGKVKKEEPKVAA